MGGQNQPYVIKKALQPSFAIAGKSLKTRQISNPDKIFKESILTF